MSVPEDLALIELVRKYPLLYDLQNPLYNDTQKKEEAWNEISFLTSASVYDCKTKWTRLRDNYRKALITRKKNANGSKDRAVKYENQLSFLKEKFSFTPRKRNILILEPGNKYSDEPAAKVLAVEQTSSFTAQESHYYVPKKDLNKNMTETKPVHEVNAFFEGIAETVKTFPKKIQIQLKRVIFNMVNDTEASLLDGNDTVVCYSMDSPQLGKPDPGPNSIVDSPNCQVSTLNDYFTDSIDSLQTTDTVPENVYGISIKEEEL